ncbi:unnamed protein product, partial [marine sediment metagenome]
MKAAYLRYIAEFTTWPQAAFATDDAPIVIGAMGDDRSGVVEVMRKRIAGKGLTAQKRPIIVRTISVGDPQGDTAAQSLESQIADCHLLFLGASERTSWPRIRAAIEGQAVVTVSEIGGFSKGRGMIEFVVSQSDGRVAMHIDLDAVRKARLRLSSQLLGLKTGVKIVRDAGDLSFRAPMGRASG